MVCVVYNNLSTTQYMETAKERRGVSSSGLHGQSYSFPAYPQRGLATKQQETPQKLYHITNPITFFTSVEVILVPYCCLFCVFSNLFFMCLQEQN